MAKIISFTDKKREIEHRIELSLTDEELNMDYYRVRLRKIEDKLNIAFLILQLSVFSLLTTFFMLTLKYQNYKWKIYFVMWICVLGLCFSGVIKRYFRRRLCTIDGLVNRMVSE